MTDDDGDVVSGGDVEYGTFGEYESGTEGDYSFTGKQRDGGTGLSYFNARYYDPEIGRFITVDPIKSGVNWYIYCSNNPLKFVDPDGLKDYFFYLEGELVPVTLGVEFAVGGVYDDDNYDESGRGDLFASAAIGLDTFGASVGIAFGLGYTERDIEGETANLDFNIGPVSFTVMIDEKGYNGLGLSVGLGAGFAWTRGTTVSTYKEPKATPKGAIPPGTNQSQTTTQESEHNNTNSSNSVTPSSTWDHYNENLPWDADL